MMSNNSAEPIVSRMIRLNQLILGKGKQEIFCQHLGHRDSLLDALFALYEECNTMQMKKHRNIAGFVDKFKPLMIELRSLRVGVSDFEVKKVIGRGHFGEVQVVREKVTGDVYAMKVLRKAETLVHQCVAFYEEERDIMALSKSPWLTKLQYAFQDSQHLYLIMEFHPGGDMLSLLEKYKCLSEEMALFYLAELVLAIHAVHMIGYAHRDIKPDNILIDRTGHIKLADFGSASKLNSENIVVGEMPVGTPDYIAPEVLMSMNDKPSKKKNYGVECDWWSFGIVAYEMLFGVTPFTDEKILVVYNNIMNFKNSLHFPDEISEQFENLIKQLLTDAPNRLGYDDLIGHELFEEINWNNIRQMVPPFVPTVTSQDDTSNFDEFEPDLRPSLSELQSKQEFNGKHLPFVGFTYTAPLSSGNRRFSSIDDSLDSPVRTSLPGTEAVPKKKVLAELQTKIAELTDQNESLKNEVEKLKSLRKKEEDLHEAEVYRLNVKISNYELEKKELKRLLLLEREDRVLTEKKTSQILKCMKMRKKRQNLLTVPGLAGDHREEDSSSPDIQLLEQLNDAALMVDEGQGDSHRLTRLLSRAKSLSPRCRQKDDEEDASKVAESLRAVKRENSLLKKEFRKMKAKDEEFATQMEEMQNIIFELEDKLQKAEQEYHRSVARSANSHITEMVTSLEKELDVKHSIISQLQKDLMLAQDNNEVLKNKLQAALSELDDVRLEKEDLEHTVEVLQQEMTSLSSESENLKMVETEKDAAKVAESLRTIKRENSLLRKELKRVADAREEDSATQLEEMQNTVFKLEENVRKAEQECRLTVAGSANSQIKEMVTSLEKELDTKHNIISQLQKDLMLAQDSLVDMGKKLQFTESELEAVQQSRKGSEQFLKALREEAVQLKSQNEELKKSLEQRSWITVESDGSDESSGKTAINASTNLKAENENLSKKIEELETELSSLKGNSKQTEKSATFEKQLKEKDDALSELKLDLRIAQREKKRLEEMSSAFRDSNRELREKVVNLENLVEEKKKIEEQLRKKVKDVETEVDEKKSDISEKIKMYEIEKAKLEERVKALQDICESHKDIKHMYVKNQGHFEEVAKQNERLKCEQHMQVTEKSQLIYELDKLKADLAAKQLECSKYEKIITALKKTSSELEEELKDFEFLEKSHEEELATLTNENKKLVRQKQDLQKEIDNLTVSNGAEKRAREQLEQQLEDLEEELENQQSLQEVEIQNLQETIDHLKNKIVDLETNMAEMEKELSNYDNDTKVHTRKAISLEEELILMKEESARLITQIASLKSSNLQLTQQLEDAMESEREALQMIDQLHNELESEAAAFNHEKVKLQETISQQTKLIDFLQVKTETMEKKKKTLSVPRIFGRKDNSSSSSVPWHDAEGLEQEKTKCRRLQDQLSQARAENMALRNELNQQIPKTPLSVRSAATIPISPVSRAMHSALTSSPSTNGNEDNPCLLTRESATRYSKLQGMKHRIPHRFSEILCMKGYKCAACLDSIHFGRQAAKCHECGATCHPKCATSLPSTCGLPTGFVQHFKSEFNKTPLKMSQSAADSKHEGWIKVPKMNKQGWERKYIRIQGSALYLFENSDAEDTKMALDCMDFASKDGEIIVISAVFATELANAAQSDLPFVLKVVYRPFTTCWPPRSLYLMTENFSDKQMWVDTLEALAKKYKSVCGENSNNKLSGETVVKLKGDKVLDVLCTFLIDDDVLLLGAMEGLYVIPLSDTTGMLKSKIEGIDSVYQITSVNDIGIVIFIAGQERTLKTTSLDSLHSCILDRSALPLDKISGTQDCHLFAVQETCGGGSPHLCSAAGNSVTLFLWNSNSKTFCKRKVIEAREPCSCIHFTQSSVIFGCDKFYELDLKTCAAEEFLDRTDPSLAGLVYGVSQLRSFPISIFYVAAINQPEEYLVCFHELGVFVDGFGQRTRPEDMKWSRLPLAFAYRAPYLFMTHFNSLEVIEILPAGNEERGVHGIMEIPNPQYLGPAASSGAVFISSSHENYVEIISVQGSSVRHCKTAQGSDYDSSSVARTESSGSKESNGDEDLDFSFSDSLLQSLDAPSGDNLSMSSRETLDSGTAKS